MLYNIYAVQHCLHAHTVWYENLLTCGEQVTCERTSSSLPFVFMATQLKQTCRSSGAARSSVTERLIAADGGAGRPGWCQKVTQWNDASKTWLKHHMTHVCAEAHFPHNLLKLRRYIPLFFKFTNAECGHFVRRKPVPLDLQLRWLTNRFIKQRVNWHRGTGVAMETDGTIASPWSGLHFLALSGGACVSASGIWVRWWTIFNQISARNPFIHLGIKKGVLLGHSEAKTGDFIDVMVSVWR